MQRFFLLFHLKLGVTKWTLCKFLLRNKWGFGVLLRYELSAALIFLDIAWLKLIIHVPSVGC